MASPYKTHFEDFVSLEDAEEAFRFKQYDGVYDALWAQIRYLYPRIDREIQDQIYAKAEKDFDSNYDVEISITRKAAND